jgi:probable phosphoglycerate mutase
MTLLALIRHGATAWNAEGRIQGRADIGLSPAGIAELRSLRPPDAIDGAVWLTSPLRRARQTAELLNGGAEIEERLIETDWGAWEGLETAVTHPRAERLAGPGRTGRDFRPPGGESPRDVQARLQNLFGELASRGGGFVGVTHKGVIRAALGLALDWDMEAKPPVKLRWRAAHLFDLGQGGRIALRAANLPLEPGP